MGTPFSYPTGPEPCEGMSNCPLIENPGNPGLVLLYCYWALCVISFTMYFLKRPTADLSSNGTQSQSVLSLAKGKVKKKISTLRGETSVKGMRLTSVKDIDDEFSDIASDDGCLRDHSTHNTTETTAIDNINSSDDAANKLDEAEEGIAVPKNSNVEAFAPNSLIQRPLRKNTFGSVCLVMWSLVSTAFLGLFLVLIIDYYYHCQLTGVDALCYYGSHPVFGDFDTNSQYFICNWFASLFWFGMNLIYKDKINIWFMHPCAMREADHIFIWAKKEQTDEASAANDAKVHIFVKWMRVLRNGCTSRALQDGRECVVAVQHTAEGLPFFTFEATRYLFNPSSGQYQVPMANIAGKSFADFHTEGKVGLSSDTVRHRLCNFGPNKIPFERRSVMTLFRDEVMTFFYLYQMLMYLVWFWFSYIFVASVEFSVVMSGAVVSTYLQYGGELTIASLTNYETSVRVRRHGPSNATATDADGSMVISSNDLVPGDIILVSDTDWIIPCDMVLLSGACIMDESGLTGESMPVQKKACNNDPALVYTPSAHHVVKHTLYAGTTVLQITQDDHSNSSAPTVLAYVTATGSATSKGELVSAILFPDELRFQYEEELEVVICLLLCYGIVAFILVVYFISNNGSDSTAITKWVYGVFTASQIFSPLLPVALKVGQIRSSQRLQTGTLTKEGMDFSGAVPIEGGNSKIDSGRPFLADLLSDMPKFGDTTTNNSNGALNGNIETSESGSFVVSPIFTAGTTGGNTGGGRIGGDVIPPVIVECMATCHNVAVYGGNKFVGNEVEVKMFTATGWSIEKGSSVTGASVTMLISPDRKTTYHVLRRFEFDHGLQCMSVVVQCMKTNTRYIVTKGSFEKMATLCRPDSVPIDFVAQGRENAMQGGYVLGIARRELTEDECPIDSSTALEMMSRDTIEAPHTLHLLGLLIFRNEPKPESHEAIKHIRRGCVRPVMITGDNAQCGQYISRACEMIDAEAHILLGELRVVEGGGGGKGVQEVVWSYMGGEGAVFSSSSHHLAASSHRNRSRHGNSADIAPVFTGFNAPKTTAEVIDNVVTRQLIASDGYPIELAVTGNECLRVLEENGQLMPLLTNIRMFARMSPENKTFIVRRLKEAGYTVGMCGDGGNDCGALRAAHAGIALSDAEASVVSPFTSRTRSPESVVDLLKEGRASLATSFANYKFLITYGMQFSVVKLCSFYYGVLMSNMSYLFIDGVALTTICYTMTLSGPLDQLSRKRPTASLLGIGALASTLGVNIIVFICLVCALLMMEADPHYVQWPSQYSAGGDWWTISDNWEATVLYIVMYMFLLSSAFIFSFGYKFRKSVLSNTVLVSNLAVLFLLTTFLILMDSNRMTNYWHMASFQFNGPEPANPVWKRFQEAGGNPSPAMSIDFRFKLYFLVLGFIIIAVFWQAEVMEGSIAELIRRRYMTRNKNMQLRF